MKADRILADAARLEARGQHAQADTLRKLVDELPTVRFGPEVRRV